MKNEAKVMAAALALGLTIWLIDALQDYWFFYEGSFWDLLIADIPSHELIVRGFLLFCALGFGGLAAGLIKQRREREDKLSAALMQAEKRQIETQALLKAAQEVLKRQGFAEAARAIFDYSREVIGAPAGYISLATKDGTENEAVFLESGGQPCAVDPGTPMPIRGLRAAAYKAGKTLYDNNFSQSAHTQFLPEGHFVLENVLFAPLLLQGEPVGLLGLANKPGGFTDHDAILASGFTDLAAIALVSKRAEEERDRLIQEVEGERSFLKTVVEQMPAGVILAEAPAGRLLIGNQLLKETWGLAEMPVDLEESLSRVQVLHPDGRACRLEEWPLMRSLKNGEMVSGVEADIILPDGRRRTLRVSSAAIRDSQGNIVAGVSTCIDITGRKLAEQALKESESLTRAIINSVPANIAVLDENGVILAVNEGWETFVRESNLWSLEEAGVGTNYLAAARRAAAGDQKAAQALGGVEAVLRGSQKTFFMEFPCHLAAQTRWFMMYATPLMGGRRGGVITYVNITDRKRAEKELQQAHDELEQRVQERTLELRRSVEKLRDEIAEREKAEARLRESEARFRTLLQTAGSYIVTLTSEGRIIEFNQEAERVTGWKRQEVEGKPGFDLFIPPESRALADAEFAKLTAGELIRGFELPIRLKDGSERLYLWNANAIWDNSTRPLEIIAVGQDITERKRAEMALERERQRLLAVLETMPAYVALLAPDYTVPFANQEFIRRFGEAERGQRCYEFLFGRTEPCPDCRTFEVLETNQPQQWEWLGPDGRIYAVYDYPFTDADGSPLILEMGIDITARKQAEEALHEQSRILEAFFEHTITPLVFLDKEFNFIRVNKAYARACHRQISDFPSRNYFDFFPDEENQALFNSVIKTQAPYQAAAQSFVFPEHPEWGVSYWDWTLVPVLDDSGGVDFLVFSLNDVTQKVLAEEKRAQLVEIIEATPDLVGTAETSGRVLYMNQAGRRMLGLGADDDLARAVISDFHPPEVVELIFSQAIPACRREGVWQGETRLCSRDGHEIPVSQVILAHRTPEGEVKFYSTVARDISDMKQAEEKLRMLTSRLLTAQESERRRLSRELHDELGQSLMVLKLQTRTLERQLPEAQKSLREDCGRILKYIDEIIENVRRLSRDLSPSILEDLGLSAALNYLFEEFRRVHGNLKFFVEQERLDEYIAAEKQINIFRVFQESLTNIAKHAHATEVRVKLQKVDNKLVGMLKDNGVGFDMTEVQARERLDKGLGLAAMDERLRIIGGSLHIYSEKGKGTSISFEVPLG